MSIKILSNEFILKEPTLSDKTAIMEFRESFISSNSESAGDSGLLRFSNYEDWLKKVQNNKKTNNLNNDVVPAIQFIMVKKQDGKVIGMCNIKLGTNDFVEKVGNIGFCIRPDERNKGYGLEMLELLLKFCKKAKFYNIKISLRNNNHQNLITFLGGKCIGEKSTDKFSYTQYEIDLSPEYEK